MRLNFAILFFATVISFKLAATSNDILFEQANQYYSESNFKAAAQLYDSIVELGVVNKEVYYNLANSHYKLGNIAPSILFYERALRIDPGDEDIKHNLNLANLRVITKLESSPPLFYKQWWKGLVSFYGSGHWASIGIGGLWLTFLLALGFIFSRSAVLKRISFFSGISIMMISILILVLAFNRHQDEIDKKQVIISVSNVYIKSAPDAGSTDLFILHEGVKAKVTDKVSEWRKIRLSDGKVGWIKQDKLSII